MLSFALAHKLRRPCARLRYNEAINPAAPRAGRIRPNEKELS